MRSVMTLDLATRTGWCCGIPGQRPRFGVQKLGGTSRAQVYSSLLAFLDQSLQVHQFGELVIEAPLVRGEHSGIEAGRRAIGMVEHVTLFAYDNSIPLSEEHVGSTRKAVLGRGTFPKGEAKGEVLAWCRQNGFEPPDDNAADALVLWKHVEAQRLRRAA